MKTKKDAPQAMSPTPIPARPREFGPNAITDFQRAVEEAVPLLAGVPMDHLVLAWTLGDGFQVRVELASPLVAKGAK